MPKSLKFYALAVLGGLSVHAATISTTVTVNASGPLSFTTGSVALTGTAAFTNGVGSGAFSTSLSISAVDSSGNLSAPFTVTLTSTDSLTGTIKLPAQAILAGATSASGSATITGGSGTYSGATGSFALTGSGTLNGTNISVSFTGPGTIVTGGSTGTTGSTGSTGTTGTTGPTGSTGSTPTVTAVLDAGSYTANIAQGSLFVVKGNNLSASGFTQFSFPQLPTTSGGVTINFTSTSGGSPTPAYLVYFYNQSGVNQLAAILPSSLATGNYNVTVVNNGATSPAFAVTVVQRKPGLITQDGSGTGLAVVQNYISASQLDIDRFTVGSISGVTISPARPGQTLIAWGTGLGPVSGGDNTASPGFDFTKNGVNVQVLVGGVSITPLYAGRAPGLAGADQINFVLPANVPTGCTVSFQISVNGALSNAAFIAIAPDATSTACVLPGFTAAQLQAIDQGGTYNAGLFEVLQFSTTQNIPGTGPVSAKIDTAGGAFTSYTGFQLASLQQYLAPSNSCQVYTTTSTSASSSPVTFSGKNLDAGKITLTGPSGSSITNAALTQDSRNNYSLAIGTEISGVGSIPGLPSIGTLVAGRYTLAGAGGKDVGAFNGGMTLGAPLSITGGLPATVNRGAGLTLNWTGGNSTDLVLILGEVSTSSGTGANVTVTINEFICTTNAGAGTFNVPASILTQLPAATITSSGSSSTLLAVESTTVPTAGNGLFTAPLTAGGTINTTFLGLIGTANSPNYQ
jgi:uncharacterized protein (TIGR03437 family)